MQQRHKRISFKDGVIFLFGAIYGDVIGSYYEVHCTKDYDFKWQPDSRFTDDSVLIAAVCRAILDDPSEIAGRSLRRRSRLFAERYRQYYARYPDAGYGAMFAAWARNPHARRGHSYANGASMRVIPIGYAYATLEQTLLQAKASCLPTHSHREAIRGAQAVAAAVFLARKKEGKERIKDYLQKAFRYDLSVPLSQIRARHVFDSRTSYSVPPAILAFLESSDYESAVRSAVSLGGDADTQACIAGGIAEAFYREIPEKIKRFCEPRIDGSIKSVVREFNQKYHVGGALGGSLA